MLAAASSFFGRTNISQNYTFGSSSIISRTSTPTPSSSATSLPTVAHSPPFNIGPWRVQSATHKVRSCSVYMRRRSNLVSQVTGKRVSIWSAEKRGPEMEKMGPASRERYIEVLKTEVSC